MRAAEAEPSALFPFSDSNCFFQPPSIVLPIKLDLFAASLHSLIYVQRTVALRREERSVAFLLQGIVEAHRDYDRLRPEEGQSVSGIQVHLDHYCFSLLVLG